MGWFSRGLKAANAALNSWFSSGIDASSDTDNHLIGNVYVNSNSNKVFTKKLKGDTQVYNALLSVTSTSQRGNIDQTNDVIVKENNTEITSSQLKALIEANATGSLTWSKIDDNSKNENTYYSSIKDWDGTATQLFHIEGDQYGLEIQIDRDKNIFYVESKKYNYKNVHLYIIGFDGSDYDFSIFDLTVGGRTPLRYPAKMDELLPLNRVSLWFELDDEMVEVLLDEKTIKKRLEVTMARYE